MHPPQLWSDLCDRFGPMVVGVVCFLLFCGACRVIVSVFAVSFVACHVLVFEL
jgi:hypothetical protein